MHIPSAFSLYYTCIQTWVYWPAAFRSISARSLVSSLVLADASPSPAMSGTAFLRPVRSQLMKSEYDVSTSIICPWPALSLHLPEGGGGCQTAAEVSQEANKSPCCLPSMVCRTRGRTYHCVLWISTSVALTWNTGILARDQKKKKLHSAELWGNRGWPMQRERVGRNGALQRHFHNLNGQQLKANE